MHDHHAFCPATDSWSVGVCGVVPYLLGFDPTGLLVAVTWDDRTSVWPCDPATSSPTELAATIDRAVTPDWWPYGRLILLAYRPIPASVLTNAVSVFTAYHSDVQNAWTVDAVTGLIYPCGGCDEAIGYPTAPTVTHVIVEEDTLRASAKRRELRARLDPTAPVLHPIAAGEVRPRVEAPAALLRRVLRATAPLHHEDVAVLGAALNLDDVLAEAEHLATTGQVPVDQWVHLLRHMPTGARANAAYLLARAAHHAGAGADPFHIIDAIGIALDDAPTETVRRRVCDLAYSIHLPPVANR